MDLLILLISIDGGVFPSVSGGWNFREESFIKDVVGDWFSQGKFRAAWGEIGNQNISSGDLFKQDMGIVHIIC